MYICSTKCPSSSYIICVRPWENSSSCHIHLWHGNFQIILLQIVPVKSIRVFQPVLSRVIGLAQCWSWVTLFLVTWSLLHLDTQCWTTNTPSHHQQPFVMVLLSVHCENCSLTQLKDFSLENVVFRWWAEALFQMLPSLKVRQVGSEDRGFPFVAFRLWTSCPKDLHQG